MLKTLVKFSIKLFPFSSISTLSSNQHSFNCVAFSSSVISLVSKMLKPVIHTFSHSALITDIPSNLHLQTTVYSKLREYSLTLTHITPILLKHYGLPVVYKICTTWLPSISELLLPYTQNSLIKHFHFCPSQYPSASPRFNGGRSFSVVPPKLWNSLPNHSTVSIISLNLNHYFKPICSPKVKSSKLFPRSILFLFFGVSPGGTMRA